MGCMHTPDGMAEFLRTASRVVTGKRSGKETEMGATIVPHVVFKAVRGTHPVCATCRAGGVVIELAPICFALERADAFVPVAIPAMPDVPRLRELGLCRGPVDSSPLIAWIKPPPFVVICADFPVQADEEAEIRMLEAMTSAEEIADSHKAERVADEREKRLHVRDVPASKPYSAPAVIMPPVDIFAETGNHERPAWKPRKYVPQTAEDWQEEWVERSAIMQHCGGMTEREADVAASVLLGEAPKQRRFT